MCLSFILFLFLYNTFKIFKKYKVSNVQSVLINNYSLEID